MRTSSYTGIVQIHSGTLQLQLQKAYSYYIIILTDKFLFEKIYKLWYIASIICNNTVTVALIMRTACVLGHCHHLHFLISAFPSVPNFTIVALVNPHSAFHVGYTLSFSLAFYLETCKI